MSKFSKKYVRVEYLALREAIALMEEAGIEGYLSFHNVVSEDGIARDLARYSDDNEIDQRSSTLTELGLSKDEVGEFLEYDGFSPTDGPWLERHYEFVFNDLTHEVTAIANVVIRKATKDSDWAISVETLFKAKGRTRSHGLNDTVIYRDWRSLSGDLQSVPRWTISNPDAAKE